MKGLIFCLPPEELSTLMALLQACQLISAAHEVTKMSAQALATCIAPNLFYNATETDLKVMQAEAQQCNRIFEYLIEEFPHLLQVNAQNKKYYPLLPLLTSSQDMETGKSVQLSSRVLAEIGELDESAESDRGRSTADDRKSKNLFRRKSRSRSRKRKEQLRK